jgi:hypothetical protein
MSKTTLLVFGLTALLVTSAAGAQMIRGNYDEPPFHLEHEAAPFDVRTYQPRIIAETTVPAQTLRGATSEGFSRLAGYIFGGNRRPDGASSKIAMTTPVESAPKGGGEFTVTFTMPPEYSMTELPRPNDARVSLRERPAQTLATARFSGVARKRDLTQLEEDLLKYLAQQGYRATSTVGVAQYDPPWTPGFLRRNELIVEVVRDETAESHKASGSGR